MVRTNNNSLFLSYLCLSTFTHFLETTLLISRRKQMATRPCLCPLWPQPDQASLAHAQVHHTQTHDYSHSPPTLLTTFRDAFAEWQHGGTRNTLVHLLRGGLHRKLAGITNPLLYTKYLPSFLDLVVDSHRFLLSILTDSRSLVGTKHLIEEYDDFVKDCLRALLHDSSWSLRDKFSFFWETRQSYGRTALCLR